MIPGEILHEQGPIKGNTSARTVTIEVTNTSDRAIQITSHFHFFEANRRLRFEREKTIGMCLDVPASVSVRLDPGETRTVRLRDFGGRRLVRGFNDLVNGAVDDEAVRREAVDRARAAGFLFADGSSA